MVTIINKTTRVNKIWYNCHIKIKSKCIERNIGEVCETITSYKIELQYRNILEKKFETWKRNKNQKMDKKY